MLGEPLQVRATFTDPGTLDTHTATIDWGDGTVTSGAIDPTNRTVTGSHTYSSNGTFTAPSRWLIKTAPAVRTRSRSR
jgi:hypothetical protein